MLSIVVCYQFKNEAFSRLQAQLESFARSLELSELKESIELLLIQNAKFADRRSGFSRAKYNTILFLDSDVEFESEKQFRAIFEIAKSQKLNGRILTGCYLNTSNADAQQRAYNWICNSWLGLKNIKSQQRIQKVIGGCIFLRRDSFLGEQNPFDCSWGGEEQFLINTAKRLKIDIYFEPALAVLHQNQSSLWRFLRRAWVHGKAKAKFEIPTTSKLNWNNIHFSKVTAWIFLHYLVVMTSMAIFKFLSISILQRRIWQRSSEPNKLLKAIAR